MRYDHFSLLPENAFRKIAGRMTLEGGKGSSSPPPAPDYTGAAVATAQGNLDATRAAAAANRVNQETPYGNLTYTQTPTYTTDYKGYQAALDQWNANGGQGDKPDISGYQTLNPDAGWNATVSLSDTGKRLLDAQNNTSLGLANLQSGALDQVGQTMSDPSRLTQGLSGVIPLVGAANYQNKLDTSGVQAIPTVDENYRNQVQNAIYGQQSQYLDPQWEQSRKSFDAQMANKGLVPGGEAYDAAYKNFQNAQQQAYSNAQMNAITGGNTAMQNYFNMGLAANQAGMGNALAEGNFTNQAENMAFNNRLQNANLANAANQQLLQQNAYLYNQPLNALSAIRSGSQVTNPTFTGVPQQQTTTGPNYLGAAQSQYGDQLGAYNAQQAANSSFMGGLMGLGGQLGAAYIMSDRRLKSNIEFVETRNGINWYDYDIFGQRVRGVMADEIEQIIPDAVIDNGSGYKMVDYARIQ